MDSFADPRIFIWPKIPCCFSPFNSLTCGAYTSASSSASCLLQPPPHHALLASAPPSPPAACSPRASSSPRGRTPPPLGLTRAGRRRALGRACRRRAGPGEPNLMRVDTGQSVVVVRDVHGQLPRSSSSSSTGITSTAAHGSSRPSSCSSLGRFDSADSTRF